MTPNNIIPFKPLSEAEAAERLRQFIAHYRPLVRSLPIKTDFDENVWDLRGKYFRAVKGSGPLNIRFVKLDTENQQKATEPFGNPFLDFAKAYVLHLMATKPWGAPANLISNWIPLLRHVEHGFRVSRPSEPPCVTSLTADLCEAINAAIRTDNFPDDKKYSLCQTLNMLVESLQELGLCAHRFTWMGMAVSPVKTRYMVGPEGDKVRKDRLPSLEAMAAMAYSFDHAEGPRERWVSAINALLSGHPARIGECWFLRKDYWVGTEVQGQQRFGLKWWPQKKAKPLVKEFLAEDPFVPVFKQCFRWLTEISAPARAIAKWYEDNPGKLHLPKELEHLRGKAILTMAEAASLRGLSSDRLLQPRSWAKRKGIAPVIDPSTEGMGIRFEDMERAVLSELPHGFPWFNEAKNIKYSDMLLLLRQGEFNPAHPVSSTMFLVPNASHYCNALDAMVDRHDLTEADGSPVRLRSHQFRHINETVAYKAGVERAWMNRQAGRARTSHEESYDDRSDAEKVAQASVASVHRSVFGELVAREPNHPKTEAEIMAEVELAKRTGHVNVTDKGCCIHNFTDKPCGEFRDCLFCVDHICVKGVPIWDRNIRAEIAAEEGNLLNAMEAADHGRYGVREHIEELILPRVAYCRQIKGLLDDPRIHPGTEFGHAPKADPYDPVVNAMRHHVELGLKKGLDVAWVERALERLQNIRSAHSERPFLTEGSQA
jgi:hypothetical protein